jgi:hypothetical protein
MNSSINESANTALSGFDLCDAWGCDGNGTVDCSECLGEGSVHRCGDDCCCCDPQDCVLCPICGGDGFIVCPGCGGGK